MINKLLPFVTLDHFNLNPVQTILTGNEKKDIETANALGVNSVLINKDINPADWEQKNTIRKLIETNNIIK